MTRCVLKVQLKISQIPHHLFGPFSPIGQLFGIFLKKALITCPLSIPKTIELHTYYLPKA